MINFNGSLGHIPHHHWQGEYQYTINKEVAYDLLQHREELGIDMIAAEGKNMFLAVRDHPVEVGFFPLFSRAIKFSTKRRCRKTQLV